jgi:hypothetical protein
MEARKRSIKIAGIFIALIVTVVFCLCTSILALTFYVKDETQIEMQVIKQIKEDWSVIPFTQITLRAEGCAANEEPVFGVLWKGSDAGYYTKTIY